MTVSIAPSREAAQSSGPGTLDALAQLSSAELEQRFAAGSAVALTEVAGDPVGRVLAVRGLGPRPLAALVRWLARTPLILWEGKSFRACAGAPSDEGFGGNRVRLGWRGIVLRFSTAEGPSVVDGAPCVQIDYDIAENPRPARRIYDELRTVAPGLYLGRGGVRLGGRVRLVLWFAIDTREQAAPISIAAPTR